MADKEPNDGWSKLKKTIVGLAGVLVVIPSLINSAYAIYASINKLPRTDSERINVEFFKKYWGKKPVNELPVSIKRGGADYQVNFSVWDEGDVFIQYGNMSQWFAFPSQPSTLASGNSIIMSAYADSGPGFQKFDGGYKQMDSFDGNNAIRERNYFNGIKERQVFDVRTGEIINRSITEGPPVPGAIKSQKPVTIDLNSADPKFEFFH
ncbi:MULTISPECIES: hypothetical protein [unclassified Pseudomonas]|uniref:hypothetical protein n=1 Tax=unclassified Pseudomonas TaxID=196821 RepID=UPI00111C138C|nr:MULTISPECIES: hypothetical protein [unclassified Pseudomonas]